MATSGLQNLVEKRSVKSLLAVQLPSTLLPVTPILKVSPLARMATSGLRSHLAQVRLVKSPSMEQLLSILLPPAVSLPPASPLARMATSGLRSHLEIKSQKSLPAARSQNILSPPATVALGRSRPARTATSGLQ